MVDIKKVPKVSCCYTLENLISYFKGNKSCRKLCRSLQWIVLTLQLPLVAIKKFLLTISIQYQAEKQWQWRKLSIWGLLVDPVQNSPNKYHKNCMQIVRRIITDKILGVEGSIAKPYLKYDINVYKLKKASPDHLRQINWR